MFTKKILAAAITSQPAANGVADAIDFDGVTDYLSRSSDLVGNVDGKTFTFSAWVWCNTEGQSSTIYRSLETNSGCWIDISSGFIRVRTYDSTGAQVISATATTGKLSANTFNHVLISCDVTSTSNRSVYVNDIPATVTWVTYLNATIDFTKSAHGVGAQENGLTKTTGRLAHIYLDYTYRDLSIEANRRLFITADRKPAANQAALNPILYLPLNDPTQPGKNLGTGGDFALNGVVARSGRGPSQFNAPYSDLDGSTDYLSRVSAPTGISDGKQFTVSFSVNSDDGIDFAAMSFSTNSNTRFDVRWADGTNINIFGYNSSGTIILRVESQLVTLVPGRNYTVACSCDLTDVNKRHISVNGANLSATWFSYTNDNISFNLSTTPLYAIGTFANLSLKPNGKLGNVFFDTKYIDLSQPANLAKFVTGTGIDAKPADLGANGEKPFGTPPLIYLPMYGNNAGKNYGTGGDFTVNSGPFTGARGPNEFWGNKADFDGSTGYLYRTSALTGVSDGKTCSMSFMFNADSAATSKRFLDFASTQTSGWRFIVSYTSTNQVVIEGYSGGTRVLYCAFSGTFSTGVNYYVQV